MSSKEPLIYMEALALWMTAFELLGCSEPEYISLYTMASGLFSLKFASLSI